MPGVFQVGQHPAELRHPADVHPAGQMGEGRTADFHYDTHRVSPFCGKSYLQYTAFSGGKVKPRPEGQGRAIIGFAVKQRGNRRWR